MRYDAFVVGGGVSGAEVVNQLMLDADSTSRLSIGLADQAGSFARGIAYQSHAFEKALLIESIAASTPTAFQDWLVVAAKKAVPRHSWIGQNQAQIVARRFDELHCPRTLFGDFLEERWIRLVDRAGRTSPSLTLLKAEVTDIIPGRDGYIIVFANADRVEAANIVLAPGAIPRRNTVSASDLVSYFPDPYESGFQALRTAIAKIPKQAQVTIIGSNASALEFIYFIQTDPDLQGRVKLRVVSPEGYLLPGNISSSSTERDYTRIFPSAPSYLACAESAVCARLLETVKGKVVDVRRSGTKLKVVTDEQPEGILADVVLDCRGAGRLLETGSILLTNLVERQFGIVRPGGKGFETDPQTHAVIGREGAFVVGPLLNGDGPGTYVESILTAQHAAASVSRALAERIKKPTIVESWP